MTIRGSYLWIGIVLLSGPGRPARACTVPVHQYALESWPADQYEILVFHDRELTTGQLTAFESLERAASAEYVRLNATVRRASVDAEMDEPTRKVWEAARPSTLPHMVVRQPVGWSPGVVAWSGPLDERSAQRILDSPVRREIAGRIARGEAAVWVLLESGREVADADALEFLQAQVQRWTKELKRLLPEDVPAARAPAAAAEEVAPHPAGFSVVRVSRNDPAEELLVNTLLNTEDDLRTFDEPMAFPVFGRGRALYALVGRGISERNIAEACAYVSDACSCWVKAQNPGADLLMCADWEAIAAGQVGGADSLDAAPGAAGAVKADVVGQPAVWSSRMMRNSLLALAGGLMIVALAAWLLIRKERRASSA